MELLNFINIMGKNKEIKEHQQSLVRDELKIKLLKTLRDFTSNEVDGYKLTNDDIIYVLSSMVVRRCE
jgi:hypothetical protein